MTQVNIDENIAPDSQTSPPDAKRQKMNKDVDEMNVVTFEKISPFRGHVAIRLIKGVAIATAVSKIPLIEQTLKACSVVENWRRCSLQNPELLDLVACASVGSYSCKDGSDITSYMQTFTLDENNTHFYRPCEDGSMAQELSIDNDSEESTVGSQLWNLPCIEFESIWENLIYDTNLKNEVMSYVYSLVHLSEMGADMKIINVNRLILLLGPPGTGKTSLCRGLTQNLAIRLSKRYPRSVMVEINSHSLFSKWFSESGKLVLKMFDQIDELAEDKKCMVFVLIDEVESLGMSRESSSSRGDPADSIRAVNALLTQIDRIRRRENVLVLCTSNLENCLDRALLDRSDLVRHVGRPSQRALYSILLDCIQELQRIGIVESKFALNSHHNYEGDERSTALWNIAGRALGLSGRAIRQIPALACSKSYEDTMSLDECLSFFSDAVDEKIKKTNDQ